MVQEQAVHVMKGMEGEEHDLGARKRRIKRKLRRMIVSGGCCDIILTVQSKPEPNLQHGQQKAKYIKTYIGKWR